MHVTAFGLRRGATVFSEVLKELFGGRDKFLNLRLVFVELPGDTECKSGSSAE